MAAPSMSPFHVDGARMGGSLASSRHGFNQAAAPSQPQAQPRKPRFIPAPPKRELSEGQMSAPQLTESQLKGIQDSIQPVIEAIQMEFEAAKIEADLVSGPALRISPDAYKAIPVIGPYFTPQEVRSQIILDADALESVSSRMLKNSLSSYLSAAQKAALETAVSDAKALRAYVQQFDLAPITGAASKLAEEHLEGHVQSIKEAIADIERDVVSVEAGSVPVTEPMERGVGLGIGGLVALATLIAVGIVIAEISS